MFIALPNLKSKSTGAKHLLGLLCEEAWVVCQTARARILGIFFACTAARDFIDWK